MNISSLPILLDLPVEGTCWAPGAACEPFKSLRDLLARLVPFDPEREALHIDCAEYEGTIDHALAVRVQLRKYQPDNWMFLYPADLKPS